jgi:hypothetical protein
MTAATPTRLGQINAAGSDTALFLKVFSGEVLQSFERYSVTLDKHFVRTIDSGRSAQFPVLGRSSASYHTPGAVLTGTNVNANEREISINGLLLAQHFIANIDEAMNHYDVRSVYSKSMGEALALQWDRHVLQTFVQAALATANVADAGYPGGTVLTSANANTVAADLITALFNAATAMDNAYVPAEDRYCFLRPAQYYLLANASNAIHSYFNDRGNGNLAEGVVAQVAGFTLVKTPHLPTTNITGTGVDAGGTTARQVVNAANAVAICAHRSAVGTVKLMDLAMESAYDINRQGTILVAKYAAGHGTLRPEASVFIRTA